MNKLLNIGSAERSVFIDPMTVTGVCWYDGQKEMIVFNEKGRVVTISLDGNGVDPEKVVARISEAGNKLAYFPSRDGDGIENPHYVAPSAVGFVTLAEKGSPRAIIGVSGIGYISNYDMTAEELASIVDSKPFLAFTDGLTEARWSRGQGLYIDPKAITSIRDNGYHVDVHFTGMESLDVRLVNGDTAERHIFAMTLAAAHGGLTHVPGARNATHVDTTHFAFISFTENKDDEREDMYSLILHKQPHERNPYADRLRVIFNTAFARDEGFKALTGQEPPKLPAP